MQLMAYKRGCYLLMIATLACLFLAGCGGHSTVNSSSLSNNSNSTITGFSASSLVFSSQTLNTSSAIQSLTFSNVGSAIISISSITVSGDFAQSNNCGATLSAGASCVVSVTFTPTALGNRAGKLSITDDATGSPQQVALSGTGAGSASALAASAAPASYTFSSQVLNSTSVPAIITLTNIGSATLSLTGVSVSGDFVQTNNCSKTLAVAVSCTVNVTFKPTVVGTRTGTVSFADNAPQSPQVVTLSGAGVTTGLLVESPTSISFGTVTTGQVSSRSLTISNPGGKNVSVTSVGTSGAGFGLSGISVPLILSPNQSSTFGVTFEPTSIGSVSGTVYLTNDSNIPDVSIPVTGTGTAAPSHEVILNWSASSSPVIGYYTYRGTGSGGPYTKMTSSPMLQTGYVDENVQAGNTYFYVVTSVAGDMSESAFSTEAKATVPTP